MSDEFYIEMAKSLVCVMDKKEVREILKGEGWDKSEIAAFIEVSGV